MATGSPFTSVSGGNWNDGGTWGNTSPGVKGTDWPGNAANVVNIGTTANQSHVVIYNVSEANQLGAITIGATSGSGASALSFLNSMTTLLSLGQVDILVQATGELRVGKSGAIIPYNYTASIAWNTTGDGNKGLNVAAGGKVNIYGDPAYYGSLFAYILATQVVIPAATNAVTVTVTGNYQANFTVGQELLIHKGGTSSGNYINDLARLAVVSAANNGANTDISCTVTDRPAALTCLVGADVLNLSRNVMLYNYGYNASLGQFNTNRPRLANATAIAAFGTNNINISDAMFAGFYVPIVGNNISFNGVIRNGYGASNGSYNCTINGIALCTQIGVAATYNSTIGAKIISSSSYATSNCYNCLFSGDMFSNDIGLSGIQIGNIITGSIYSNIDAIEAYGFTLKGNLGYDSLGVVKANSHSDINFTSTLPYYGPSLILNSKVPSSLTITGRNDLRAAARILFEHYQQVLNAQYILDAYGDVTKVAADGGSGRPTQRSGGSANVIEVAPQSNCGPSPAFLAVLGSQVKPLRIWAAAGVSRTYTFYLTTTFVALANAKLVLYGEYLDNSPAGTGHLATLNTSGAGNFTTQANNGDWSQTLSITINPAVEGFINFYVYLMQYESGKKVWIDPLYVVS